MRRLGAALVTVLFVAGCVAAGTSPEVSPSPPFSPYLDPDPSPPFSPYLDPDPSPPFSPYLDPDPSPPFQPPSSAAPSSTPATASISPTSSLAIPARVSAYAGAVQLWTGTGGTLIVVIPVKTGTLIVIYGPEGDIRPGWPVALAAHGCRSANAASDGTIRVVCSAGGGTRAFAFDPAGRMLKGWPVDIVGSMPAMPAVDPVVVGTRLVALVVDDLGDLPARASVASVDAAGRLTTGVPVPFSDWSGWWALGPDGTGYYAHYEGTDGDLPSKTSLLAFGPAGIRPGWPIEIAGMVSRPTFGPGDRIRLLRGRVDASPTEVLELTSPPRVSLVSKVATPLGGVWEGAGASFFLAPAIAAPDGGLFMVSGGIGSGTGVIATMIAGDGSERPGWPYRDGGTLAPSDYCGPQPGDVDVTGCGWFRASPVAGPDGSLYLLEMTGGLAGRGRIAAVDSDGRARAGWPVVLSRAGTAFWSAVVADSGRVYAVAVEPEGDRTASATILAIEADGSVAWRRAVQEP